MIFRRSFFKILYSLFVISLLAGCAVDSSDQPQPMIIANYFPMDNISSWGSYSTITDLSSYNGAQLSRRYTSVTINQLTDYSNQLKKEGFTEGHTSQSSYSAFIKTTGSQGYVWGYEQYTNGDFLVFWRTDRTGGTPGAIGTWPSTFNTFPQPPENGRTYLQTDSNIVRFYDISGNDVIQYQKDLLSKGFTSYPAQKMYIYQGTRYLYGCSMTPIELAKTTLFWFTWHIELR